MTEILEWLFLLVSIWFVMVEWTAWQEMKIWNKIKKEEVDKWFEAYCSKPWTLKEWAKRLDPANSTKDDLVFLLKKTNKVLAGMKWKEGKLPKGFRGTILTRLPHPSHTKSIRRKLAKKK